MTLDRVRLTLLALGGVVLSAGGLWMALSPGPLTTRLWGVFGVIFFGFGTWATLRLARSGASYRQATNGSSRTQRLVLPVVLLFTLPWGFKVGLCLPLLCAWALLLPEYRERRVLLVGTSLLAGLLAVAQAAYFSIGVVGEWQATASAGSMALQASFLLLVLCLDASVLWEVHKRLRSARRATSQLTGSAWPARPAGR